MTTLTDHAIIERKELETLRLRARLKFEDTGVPIPLASIVSWTVTLYCAEDKERSIIGERDEQVLVWGGVIAPDLDGFFRYEPDGEDILTAFFVFPPTDQAILNRALDFEKHICQHEIVVAGVDPDPGDTIRPKWVIQVENLGRVG